MRLVLSGKQGPSEEKAGTNGATDKDEEEEEEA